MPAQAHAPREWVFAAPGGPSRSRHGRAELAPPDSRYWSWMTRSPFGNWFAAPWDRTAGRAARRQAQDAIRHNHKRFAGSGYPDGLRGEEIPLLARILPACEVLDAMVDQHPCRPALAQVEGLRRIQAGAGTHIDPAVVKSLCRMISSGTASEDVAAPSRRPGLGRSQRTDCCPSPASVRLCSVRLPCSSASVRG